MCLWTKSHADKQNTAPSLQLFYPWPKVYRHMTSINTLFKIATNPMTHLWVNSLVKIQSLFFLLRASVLVLGEQGPRVAHFQSSILPLNLVDHYLHSIQPTKKFTLTHKPCNCTIHFKLDWNSIAFKLEVAVAAVTTWKSVTMEFN